MAIIKNRIEATRLRNLERAKKHYALAKKLGLNSYEAGAVSQWSELRIREYIKSKNNN